MVVAAGNKMPDLIVIIIRVAVAVMDHSAELNIESLWMTTTTWCEDSRQRNKEVKRKGKGTTITDDDCEMC